MASLRKSAPSFAVLIFIGLLSLAGVHPAGAASATPRITLTNPAINDQDDLCIWLHPSDTSLSTFIVSDKYAGRLFVYDLGGALLQQVDLPGTPGNIDLRYNFPFAGELIDIVAHNDRDNDVLVVHRVDRATRMISRIDPGNLDTGANYGLALFRSPENGAYYAFTTSKNGAVRQFRLEDASGTLSAPQVRGWSLGGITEGCVADDETGVVYFAEENTGIWEIGAEPTDPTGGPMIARTGDASGLVDDIEGLTIYYAADGRGYLIASSQGNSSFKVYERAAPHGFVTTLTITGTGNTDGIDVINVDLGPAFPYGVFAVHNDNESPKTIEVCGFEDLGLSIDTRHWDPRATGSTAVGPLSWATTKSRFR